MRERLIRLLQEAEGQAAYYDGDDAYGVAADYLLDNGVIVPPVKVGQTVYWIINNTKACRDCKHYSSFYGMDEMCDKRNDIVMNPRVSDKPLCEKQFYEIKEYKPDIDWIFSHRERFGKTVFLTREAAEAALKARENECTEE